MNTKKTKFLILLLLFAGKIWAQNIQVIMSPKPSPYLSDWQTKTETVKLIITNTSQNAVDVKIKTELLNGSGNIFANTDQAKMPVLNVPVGTSIYNAEDVFPLSAVVYKGNGEKTAMQTGRIPDDNYKLCVALTDPKTNGVVGTSGTVCKIFTITAFQAPTLIAPSAGQEIPNTGINGIVFRWTPCIPKPQGISIYRLQVWEVLEGQTNMIALRTNQPIIEKDYKEQLQAQWPIDFAKPEEGKSYVWTITPLDGEERKLVDGVGFAEPFGFSIAKMIPFNCCNGGTWGNRTAAGINVTCGATLIDNNITCSSSKIFNYTYNCANSMLCPNIAIIKYEIWNAGVLVTTATGNSGTNVTLQMPANPNIYSLKVFAYCGAATSAACDNCQNRIRVKCTPSPTCCTNSNWGNLNWTGQTNLSCGKSIVAPLNAGSQQILNFIYNCNPAMSATSPPCGANITYKIKDNTGAIISTNTANSGTARTITMPTTAGNYCLIAYGICNNTMVCDSCEICFTVASIPPPSDCCKGSSWQGVSWKGQMAKCGVPLPKPLECKSEQYLLYSFNCKPNCKSTIRYNVVNSAGTIMSTTNVPNGEMATIVMPNVAGKYCMVAYGLCDGIICDSCIICFDLECKDIDCCKGSNWGKLFWNGKLRLNRHFSG